MIYFNLSDSNDGLLGMKPYIGISKDSTARRVTTIFLVY